MLNLGVGLDDQLLGYNVVILCSWIDPSVIIDNVRYFDALLFAMPSRNQWIMNSCAILEFLSSFSW